MPMNIRHCYLNYRKIIHFRPDSALGHVSSPPYSQFVRTDLSSVFDTSWSSFSAEAKFLVTSRGIPWNAAEKVDQNVLPLQDYCEEVSKQRERMNLALTSGASTPAIRICIVSSFKSVQQEVDKHDNSLRRLS